APADDGRGADVGRATCRGAAVLERAGAAGAPPRGRERDRCRWRPGREQLQRHAGAGGIEGRAGRDGGPVLRTPEQLLFAVLTLELELHAVDRLVEAEVVVQTDARAVADARRAQVRVARARRPRRVGRAAGGAAIAVDAVAVVAALARVDDEVAAHRH